MARVRNHAAEYAALKARAQAAGMTTRAYRRARKAEPTKYYSPRAQVTLKRRADLIAGIAAANRARVGSGYSDDELTASAQYHYSKANKDVQTRWSEVYQEYQVLYDGEWQPFWDDFDELEYEGFPELFYYHD